MEKQKLPPQFPLRFFQWFCHPKLRDHIEGDLLETYHEQVNELGEKKADLKFTIDVLQLFRPGIIKPLEGHRNLNLYGMIKSYFKIALRTIIKNKTYSFINALGLALGLCACLTIYLIVKHEFSFDTFHPDKDRIYRLVMEGSDMGEKGFLSSVPAPAALAVRSEISGIEVVTGFHYYDSKITIPNGDNTPKKFEAFDRKVIITEPEYFSVFHYKWLAGNAGMLSEPFRVVLSERRAHDYFGSLSLDKIIGKVILYDSLQVSVVGIVQDWNQNTDFPFTDFISFATIQSSNLKTNIQLDNWGRNESTSQAFAKLHHDKSPEDLTKQLTSLIRKHDPDNKTNKLKLQPLADLHFNPNYQPSPSLLPTLYSLMGLALFILLIAAINFVNLSTAQAVRRSKEIGIRKVLGSFRTGLIFQFLIETFVLTTIAVGIAVLMVNPVLSFFRSFIPQGITFDLFSYSTLAFLPGITLFTALLAGCYPAYVVSSHLPAVNLKGTGIQKGSKKWLLRKGLIVFQFSISLFFIIATIVITNQMHYIQSKDKGFTTKNIVTLRTLGNNHGNKTKLLADKIKQVSGVEQVALQSMQPMGFGLWFNKLTYKGKSVMETLVSIKPGASDFIPFYNIHLAAGRNIVSSDSLKELVINRYYSKELGFANPSEAIGQLLYFDGRPYPIVGVVDDFHERSFHDPIGSCVIGNFNFFVHSIGIKLPAASTANNRIETLSQIEKLFKQIYPDEPINIHFVEEEIEQMHESDQKTATLMNASMMITIFISCMGIFGLAMFTSELRTKEIGIRKVLGATVAEITTLLSKEFIILIFIAILIASPVSWFFMNKWLMGFAFRIDNTIWVYIISGFVALAIGLITISFKTIAAALANPVNSLRSE